MNILDPDFMPLSVRRGRREPFRMHDGIPTHMRALIDEWAREALGANTIHSEANARWVVNILQLPYGATNVSHLLDILHRDDDEMLDLLDVLTRLQFNDREELDSILRTGGSAWRVDVENGGLLERISAEAQASYERGVAADDLAAEHLSDAWRHAFGRSPDAGDAWGDAIRAVEAALHPIVTPHNQKATLGNIKNDIRTAPAGKFTFQAPGDDPKLTVQGMLDCIPWQPGRHGQDSATATLETARVVVLQATAIVAAVGEGLITRS